MSALVVLIGLALAWAVIRRPLLVLVFLLGLAAWALLAAGAWLLSR